MVATWQFASTFYFRLDAGMTQYCGPQHSTTTLSYLPSNAQSTAAQLTSAQLNSSVPLYLFALLHGERANIYHQDFLGLLRKVVPELVTYPKVHMKLSVQDLLKKIGDMQREFQSRIIAVEQYVNQHKTSSTANDSPVDNVFSDTRDFDHDSFSRFTENPVDRAALMNKITDMRVDFQRRITKIEQYLKISTSSNVEKTSNVVQDCMDVDKNPSCGYDNHDNHVKLGYTESMCVDRDVKVCHNQNVDNHSMDFDHDPKTSFEYDVDTKNVDNHCLDVGHDPKALKEPDVAGNNFFHKEDQQFSLKNLDVQQEALEKPNVAGNKFFHEEDQQFSSKNLDALEEPNVAGKKLTDEEDQQFSTKKLDAQLEMEEHFEVESLCSLIDFDFPKVGQISNLKSVYWLTKARVPRGYEGSTRDVCFYTESTLKRSTNESQTDCHAGNPCELNCDPTA
ncbi:hypothetical protein Tco_0272666 [Tanacetum coccineum]